MIIRITPINLFNVTRMLNDKYLHKNICSFSEVQHIYNTVLIQNIIMNILNFMQRFPDEASCIAYLKEQREQSGIVCKHCGCMEHRWNANKLVFECKHCHHR